MRRLGASLFRRSIPVGRPTPGLRPRQDEFRRQPGHGRRLQDTDQDADTLSGSAGQSNLGGGAAYDPTNNSIWVSDGVKIRNLDLTGKTLCEFAATVSGKDWAVTGLAFHRAKRQLIQLEMGPGSGTITMNVRTYDASKCPPTALPLACQGRTMTGTAVSSAGIAYDGARDLIYYCQSFSGFLNGDHTIHVAMILPLGRAEEAAGEGKAKGKR